MTDTRAGLASPLESSLNAGHGAPAGPIYLEWTPCWAGGLAAAALSFVLLAFGFALGLGVASPSSSWRDTSAILSLVSGLWLLLTALASFGLGGYLAGRLRIPLLPRTRDEVEFRDGVHGLLVWAIAVLIGAVITAIVALAATRTISPVNVADAKSSTTEPLFALELDQLFRSDRRPADAGDPELRAQAARIISSGLGHRTMAPEDRAYLVRLVEVRTGLPAAEAESRVTQVVAKSRDAVGKARRSAVILAFMIGASLMVGAAVAWLAAAAGGQHRDNGTALDFWRRWDVDRGFMVRYPVRTPQ
jgi:hypothetical protein